MEGNRINRICCNTYIDTNVCYTCGIMINEKEISEYAFEIRPDIKHRPNFNNSYNKIYKMQSWSTLSNKEMIEYKLTTYIINLCKELKITEHIPQITEFTIHVMNIIRDNFNGSKRSRVKDALIIMCIYYTYKTNNTDCNYTNLTNQFNKKYDKDDLRYITSKYISRAITTILDLINQNKLLISDEFKNSITSIEQPMNYINKIIKKYKLNISDITINQICNLVDICTENDIINDSTPLSLGVGCFYYILKINNIKINLNIFSEIYDISSVTILKTYKKLKIYDTKLKELLKIT